MHKLSYNGYSKYKTPSGISNKKQDMTIVLVVIVYISCTYIYSDTNRTVN